MTQVGNYLELIQNVDIRKLQSFMKGIKFEELTGDMQDDFTHSYNIARAQLLTIDNLMCDLKHTKTDEDKLYELFDILEQAERYRFNFK